MRIGETHAPQGTSIAVEGLTQRFGGNTVLDRIDLRLAPGQVLALLGPSGCGKTTLLKLLAGLTPVAPGHGRIRFGETLVAGDGQFVPPEQRGLGMVFQDYALWPHMTVGRNVAFALEMRGVPRSERAERVAGALEIVGLKGYAERQPSSLSGGQQQRVALARAIVAKPQVLLFDEPLSNLDRELRESLCHEMGLLLRAMGTTAVYVTHDQEEAFALADSVAVMHGGRIQQLSSPEQLMQAPASALVADFLKLGNVLHADDIPPAWRVAAQALARGDQHQHLFIPQGALHLGTDMRAAMRARVVAQRWRHGRFITHVKTGAGCKGLSFTTAQRLGADAIVDLALDWPALRWLPQAA
ncbi:ABC transporter ATP-binding protein [Comamonas antarctica]|uniref:ABC transporter ATP-binding protein n=1 Tax=Comamonas antarctica TaxID=2743470 RepID=UPI0028EB3E4E|nr:ABC transporter ATP-binding protein [Comamonas antarctica]